MKIKNNISLALLFSLSYFSINILLNLFWRFHQSHNDYWDLLFIAKNIDFRNVFSLANPCVPIGYTTLLHFIIKSGSEITIPIIVNLLFSTTTVFVSILYFQKIMSKESSIISAFLLCFFPQYFFYANQGGADPGSVMFFTLGALVLLNQLYLKKEMRRSVYLISGILLGLGAIFRFHVLVGAVILIFTATILNLKQWRFIVLTALGVFIAYSPQIIVNLSAQNGAFETKLGASNIYDLMYSINWYRISTDQISTNALEIISTDYLLFFKKYIFSFIKFFIKTGLLPFIAYVFSKNKLHKNLSLFTLVFVILYFGIFSATLSGRQVLLPLPLSMMCFGFLYEELFIRLKNGYKLNTQLINYVKIIVIFAIFSVVLAKDGYYVRSNLNKYELAKKIESYLISMGCTNSLQTFTTDYDHYFRRLPNYTGYFNGGWSRWGTYKYNEAFPEFNVSSVKEFIHDCKRYEVRFLILTSNAKKLNSDLGKIFNQSVINKNVRFLKEFQGTKIFEIL